MNIALIGYGKMGQMIEEIALQRGHQIVLTINIDNLEDFNQQNISKADVAIEFTGPDSAFENVKKCFDFGVPVVCGSTGWNDKIEIAKQLCLEKNCSFLHASNFSVGVNLFFEVNKFLAKMMDTHKEYNVSMREIHHTQKKDAPSGTAVTLAEQILENISRKTAWINEEHAAADQIAIASERVDPAPGTHVVKYSSDIDDIEIIHTAHNRRGFALGAVLAAEHIRHKKGIFSMKDVLNIASL